MKPFIGKYPFEVETFQVDYTGGLSFGFLANKMLITAGNHANERGFGKERLSADGKTWVLSRLAIEIDEYPNEGDTYYVEGSYLNEIYLNHALIEKRQMKMTELLDRCTEFLSQVSGIKRVHTSLALLSGAADAEVRGSYNADRSGDLILEVAPGWTLVDDRWNERVYYNRTHVPVPIIFYGAGFDAQWNRTPVSVESIAPTIAHILRISAPNACSTRPLE